MHAGEDALTARIRGYEMAARMQTSVPLVTDLEGEPAETLSLYGVDRRETTDFGRACLIGRRLLERGVRFVQLLSGGTFGSPRRNWDGHEDMKANHGQEALRIDRPVAGLLRDLRRRGMLDDTLVLFTTEFGRTPFTQSAADVVGLGRDHNQYGFSVWLAGAGLKHGIAHGSTDEIGWKAADGARHLARLSCDGAAPAGHRPQTIDILSQWNPAPADQRPRRGRQTDPGLSGRWMLFRRRTQRERPHQCQHRRESRRQRRSSSRAAAADARWAAVRIRSLSTTPEAASQPLSSNVESKVAAYDSPARLVSRGGRWRGNAGTLQQFRLATRVSCTAPSFRRARRSRSGSKLARRPLRGLPASPTRGDCSSGRRSIWRSSKADSRGRARSASPGRRTERLRPARRALAPPGGWASEATTRRSHGSRGPRVERIRAPGPRDSRESRSAAYRQTRRS